MARKGAKGLFNCDEALHQYSGPVINFMGVSCDPVPGPERLSLPTVRPMTPVTIRFDKFEMMIYEK